jgi:1-deoxy-D-xylulose-5-phosphate reductoisomerase
MFLTNSPRTISLFGSTGSIGTSVLDLVRLHADKFKIKILTAHKNIDVLISQAREFKPECICISDESLYTELKQKLDMNDVKILTGVQGLIEAASIDTDIHIAAIVGFAGLKPMMAGMAYCKIMAIANKEPLVAAGSLVKELAAQHGTKIIPIDSEHNAIFQVFEKQNHAQISKLYITASGGPFRDMNLEQCEHMTPAQALKHPNWSMGAKISIDSATMMNKALEVIEAHELFDMPADKIDVLLHPQSTIHSMVEYDDGSVLAQMGASDMRTPIAYVLGYPHRITTSGQRLSFDRMVNLNLSPLDLNRFPAITMAKDAIRQGLYARIAMNAANEVLVDAFLKDNGHISFGRIVPYIKETMAKQSPIMLQSVDDIVGFDQHVRAQTIEFLLTQNLHKKIS